MKKSRPCGPACDALNPRQHAFHLLKLEDEAKVAAGSTPTSDAALYVKAGFSKASADGNVVRVKGSERFQAAMRFHRDQLAKKVEFSRDKLVELLAPAAETTIPEDEIAFRDKLSAIQEIAKLCGLHAPTRVAVEDSRPFLSQLQVACLGDDPNPIAIRLVAQIASGETSVEDARKEWEGGSEA